MIETTTADGDRNRSASFFEQHLGRVPIIGIFRGTSPVETLELCETAWDSGVELVEIPVQRPEAMPSLRSAVAAGVARGAIVGAGSVTTVGQLDDVLAAGAGFVVSPGFHPAVVDACIARRVPVLPGVATSSDIAATLERGLSWLKAFPAAQLTPGWVTAQHGPFPDARFVATGGVSAANARQFLNAGCSAIATASAFAEPEQILLLIETLTMVDAGDS